MTPRRRRPLPTTARTARVVVLPVARASRFTRRHWPILLAALGVVLVLTGYLATTLLSQRRSHDVAVLGSVVEDQNTALASAGLPTVNPTTVVSGTADLPSTTTTTVTVTPDGRPTTVPGPTVTATVVVPGPDGSPVTTTVTATPGAPVTITAPGAPPVTITMPASTTTVTATATETATTTETTTETTTAPAPPPVVVTVTEPAPPPVTVTETTTETVTAEPPGDPEGPANPEPTDPEGTP